MLDMKIKLEEAETDLALLREEAEAANSADGSDGAGVTHMQLKLKDEEIARLKEALIKLRDLNTEEKNASIRAIKQGKADSEELAHRK